MNYSLDIIFSHDGEDRELYNTAAPRECPRCHKAGIPRLVFPALVNPKKMTISYFCESCSNIYLADYKVKYIRSNLIETLELIRTYPKQHVPKAFSEHVDLVSPDFVTIFSQASKAESDNLDKIAGVGYRKALEFLVKDFAIHLNQDNEQKIETIKKMPLAKCINEYIQQPKMQSILSKAAWIGNDETHYVKKHPEEDIETLKSLIDISVHWIDMDLQAKELDERIINPKDQKN